MSFPNQPDFPNPNNKPDPPPPPYSEFSPSATSSSHAPNTHQTSAQSTPFTPAMVTQYHFGPTPLTDTQVLLPYAFYGERATVDGRARWRFVGALLWAVAIYCGVAFLIGIEAWGDGWWTIDFETI